MTQSFDEWYFDAKQHNIDGFTNREFYEAGQQSRQEGVDKLRSEIDELKWMLKNSNGQADEFCKKSIELQKRVDEVVNLIEPSDEISHRLYRELIKILKGNQDG